MNQPEPMIGDPLDFIEIVPLISDLPVLNEQLVNVLPMTVAPLLQDLRIGVLEILVLEPLLLFSPHDGLKRAPSQGYAAVEVFSQVVERLGAGVLNPLDHSEGFLLHNLELGSQVCQVPFGTVSLNKDG